MQAKSNHASNARFPPPGFPCISITMKDSSICNLTINYLSDTIVCLSTSHTHRDVNVVTQNRHERIIQKSGFFFSLQIYELYATNMSEM